MLDILKNKSNKRKDILFIYIYTNKINKYFIYFIYFYLFYLLLLYIVNIFVIYNNIYNNKRKCSRKYRRIL
jgi:hypothetical protein